MRKPFRDSWFLALASLFLLALVGGGVWAWRKAKAPAAPAPVVQKPVEPVIPPGQEVSFTSTLQAQVVVAVPSPIEGVLESVEMEAGTEVAEGQLLGRIKNQGLESAQAESQQEVERVQTRINNLESSIIQGRLELSRAMADAERARAEFDKTEKFANRQQLLYNEKATPRLTYEKAQKDYAQAKSDYDTARETSRQADERLKVLTQDLDAARRMMDEKNKLLEAAKSDQSLAEVHSPVDGVLVKATKAVGEEVDPSIRDLFQIAVDPSLLEVLIDPDPNVAGKLQEGLPALVQVLEISGDAMTGEVKKTGSGQWKVEFTTGDPNIKPGLNAIVKVKLP